jgi:hypothetical protein
MLISILLSVIKLCVIMLMLSVIMLSVVMLIVIMLIVVILIVIILIIFMLTVIMLFVIILIFFMVSVIMLSVVMLSVIMLRFFMLRFFMLSVIMLIVIILNAIMLKVAAPRKQSDCGSNLDSMTLSGSQDFFFGGMALSRNGNAVFFRNKCFKNADCVYLIEQWLVSRVSLMDRTLNYIPDGSALNLISLLVIVQGRHRGILY